MSTDPSIIIRESLLFSESVQQLEQVPVSRGNWAQIRAHAIMSALEEAGYDVVAFDTQNA